MQQVPGHIPLEVGFRHHLRELSLEFLARTNSAVSTTRRSGSEHTNEMAYIAQPLLDVEQRRVVDVRGELDAVVKHQADVGGEFVHGFVLTFL